MRNIYIMQETSDDAKKVANTYYGILSKNNSNYKTPEKVDDFTINCGSYQIQFLSKRKWEAKMSSAPQSGYLTIPYNRFLLSPSGVPNTECNLKGMQNLLIKDKEGEAE